MVRAMQDWKTWVLIIVIGLTMSVTVRIIAETTSGHNQQVAELVGHVDALEERILKLETSQHPSTTKRYTSEDAARDKAAIYKEIGKLQERLKHEPK